jgi:hypothetical protein
VTLKRSSQKLTLEETIKDGPFSIMSTYRRIPKSA